MSGTTNKQTVRTRFAALLRRAANALDPQQIAVPPQNAPATKHGPVEFAKKLFRRFLIWMVSLCVAFYVPLEVFGLPYPLSEWENRIAKDGRFTDVFLCTVAMVVLSGSDLLDNIIARRRSKGDTVTVGCAILFMVVYFLFIFFGMPVYGATSGTTDTKSLPWVVLEGLLVIGLAGEIMIASTPD